MNYSQELKLKQTQGIILTPEMKQSLSMLQMSCMELKDFLDKEMMENPLLEVNESNHNADIIDDIQKISWSAYVKSCTSYNSRHEQINDSDEDHFTFEKYAHNDMTYQKILDTQFDLCCKSLTSRQIRIGHAILDHINDDGYLFADLDDLAISLNVELEEIDVILEIIQHFYPAGTGARNVSECLYLQLREEQFVPESYKILLFHHLEDLSELRIKKIESETGISPEVQIELLKKIKTLHPRPGSQFANTEKTYYVIPDGSINWDDGTLSVKLNNIGSPTLIINPFYQKMLTSENCNPRTRNYIIERMNRALTILHNIEAREKTIESIAFVIAEEQQDYLLKKTDTLKPLTQKQIAQRTGLHESTISRTVRGKYFLTPRGTIELKSLFCNSYMQGEKSIAIDIVKKYIHLLIEQEDPCHPLTDQKIADYISTNIVSIARRTVAKYREEMGIRTAAKRRVVIS